jgi:peptidoglycan/LPS O-acetylase OafA/YrhL
MQYEQNTQDIRSLVKNYTIVPGLVLALIGGFGAFFGAFNMLWDKWLYWVLVGSNQDSWFANLIALGSIILPLALYLFILYTTKRYYESHFGQAKPRAEETRKLTIELVAAGVAYFFVGQLLDIHLHPPVSITMLIFALFLLIHWWLFARTQRHYPLLAAIAVVLSVVPLFNSTVYFWLYIKYTSPDWYGFNIAICAGLLLLIAGLLDHWYLVRMFARVRRQVLANSPYGPDVTDGETGIEEL